jgi:lysophospholipase L1-like esterase
MSRIEQPQFGLGKSLLFSVILVTLFLGLGEIGVRGWAYFLREEAERFDLSTQTFVLVPGKHRSEGGGTATINSDGFVGDELQPDGPDLWRIATIGDSCTYGEGDSTHPYAAQLQALLREHQRPGHRYEVVNAGISGLNSELALRRLRTKVLALNPDVVTIYIGWNDLMKVDPLGAGSDARWARVAGHIDRLWLVKGLRKLLFFYVRPYLRPPATGPESHTGRIDGFRPTLFEENLRSMIASVRSIESRPVLLTLPTVVRPDMTLDGVRGARVVFPYFPSAYGVLDLLELIGTYNDSIRRVADEKNVPLIDLAQAFEKLDDPTGYFLDTMHTTREGARLIAQVMLRDLETMGLLDPSGKSPEGR